MPHMQLAADAATAYRPNWQDPRWLPLGRCTSLATAQPRSDLNSRPFSQACTISFWSNAIVGAPSLFLHPS
eukprot:1970862-Pleurochrysis_carterae.AAC.1